MPQLLREQRAQLRLERVARHGADPAHEQLVQRLGVSGTRRRYAHRAVQHLAQQRLAVLRGRGQRAGELVGVGHQEGRQVLDDLGKDLALPADATRRKRAHNAQQRAS